MTSTAQERRTGRSLILLVRVVWVVVAILTMGTFLASLPTYFAELQSVCTHGAQRCADGALSTLGQAHGLREMGLSTGFYAAYNVALSLVFVSVWWLTGLLIFWRRSENRMALLAATMLVTFPTFFLGPVQTLADVHPLWRPLASFLTLLGFTSIIVFLYTFPDGRFIPRWTSIPALIWIANDGTSLLFPRWYGGAGTGWLGVVGFLGFLIPALVAIGSQIYRYRRTSDPVQRQQTKWIVFGIAFGMGGFLVVVLLQGALFGFGSTAVLVAMLSQAVTTALFVVIPLSIGLAILHSGLWDIDVIINRTLVYGSLTMSLVLAYLGSVVVLQYVLRAFTGENSQIVVVASTLVIAALFNPLRRRVQELVDRRFYRRKYDAAKTMEAFSAKLREETDLGTLSEHLVWVVSETMRPAHVSLWLRPEAASDDERAD